MPCAGRWVPALRHAPAGMTGKDAYRSTASARARTIWFTL
jgi:hypothetical protein